MNFTASPQSEDTVDDAPYIDLMNEAMQLLAEGTVREDRQIAIEQRTAEGSDLPDPEWLEASW